MNLFKKALYKHAIPLLGRVKLKNNRYINVIYYHDVVLGEGDSYMRMNVNKFKQQMRAIKQAGYQTLLFSDLDKQENMDYKGNTLLITFDDGWLSNYTIVFDIMKELELKYNVFLAAGLMDADPQYLTWSMVEEMAASNICGFGAHTFDHVSMFDAKEDSLDRQVQKTNCLIEKHAGYYPKDFCYPYGQYTKESLSLLIHETPYTRIYTSDMNYSYSMDNKVIFGRNAISEDENMGVFWNKVRGYYNVFDSIRGKNHV